MDSIKNHISKTGIILFICSIFLSCIKQSSEVCPPAYQAIVTVKDKNYSNIADLPDLLPKDEQLAFKQYVSNISYRLLSRENDRIVDNSSFFPVEDNAPNHTLDFSTIEPGSYIFNIYGNTTQPSGKSITPEIHSLHPSNQEGDDLYILHDTIVFSPTHPTVTLPLLRSKGALWVQIENLPDSVVRIEKTIQHIYADIDENLDYSGETTVTKDFTADLQAVTSLFTLLAPTYTGKESILRIGLYTRQSTTPYMFIPDIPVNIERNKITAFKFNFKLEGGIEVWTTANGLWTKLHDLNLIPNE